MWKKAKEKGFGNNNDSSDRVFASEAEDADSLEMLIVKGIGYDTPIHATLA